MRLLAVYISAKCSLRDSTTGTPSQAFGQKARLMPKGGWSSLKTSPALSFAGVLAKLSRSVKRAKKASELGFEQDAGRLLLTQSLSIVHLLRLGILSVSQIGPLAVSVSINFARA